MEKMVFLDLLDSAKLPKMQNSEMLKSSKWQFLELQNNQNWFHVKSVWRKIPKISTLCSWNTQEKCLVQDNSELMAKKKLQLKSYVPCNAAI